MSDCFVGEIRMFAGLFAPQGWAYCNGQLLAISDYDTLYALLGTTYGGDGSSTFGVPDLQSRLPIGQGNGTGLTPRVLGQNGGSESVGLIAQQLPVHSHYLVASSDSATLTAANGTAVLAKPDTQDSSAESIYAIPGTNAITPAVMAPQSIGYAGSGLPHENRMPALAVGFIIALTGIFPSRN